MVTWVEKDNSSKAPQFCLIHLHVPHLWHQLCQHSAQKQQETEMLLRLKYYVKNI